MHAGKEVCMNSLTMRNEWLSNKRKRSIIAEITFVRNKWMYKILNGSKGITF